ncbi:hypothetical protein LINPERHAP2_LOCUS20975 [Linum perenne]
MMLLWSIWKERNARVLSNDATVPTWVVKMGLDELADWEQANENDVVTSSRETSECKKWHPPREGMVTCNTDVATFRDE